MNVIVKKHYPVEKLPADLREGLGGETERVTVEIAVEDGDDEKVGPPLSVDDAVALMRKMQIENRGKGVTEAEAVKRIRDLRDDRDIL